MKRLIHRAQCVVFIDADNTLWDTNRVYADAQLSLLTDVERASGRRAKVDNRLGWLREIDQALAERHHAGLRYPPRLLAKAVALALIWRRHFVRSSIGVLGRAKGSSIR